MWLTELSGVSIKVIEGFVELSVTLQGLPRTAILGALVKHTSPGNDMPMPWLAVAKVGVNLAQSRLMR